MSLFGYDNPVVRQLIYHVKTVGSRKSIKMVGIMLAMTLKNIADNTPVTLIPRSSSRFIKYGFDQTELISETYVRLVPHANYIKLFDRRSYSKPQKQLRSNERQKNAHNSLYVTQARSPREIVVIDDIITTGSTANAACSLLKKKGAKEISLVFIAGGKQQ